MTLQKLRLRVAEVLSLGHDPEVAHGKDDDLRCEFLAWLADGARLPNGDVAHPSYIAEMAAALLLTKDLTRWYA